MSEKLYFQYWGKTEKGRDCKFSPFHLLPYHCLDVAAVADIWWQKSIFLRNGFSLQSDLPTDQCLPWVLFFVCLHDLGKIDLRFQMKSPNTVNLLQSDLVTVSNNILKHQAKQYDHGSGGYRWFVNELVEYGFSDFIDQDAACDWITCVAGHHGTLPDNAESDEPAFIDRKFIERDREARLNLVNDMQNLFLAPAGLALSHIPENVPDFLAGFCSVCDWIGSNSDWFSPVNQPMDLSAYYQSRLLIAEKALNATGILSSLTSAGGMRLLFPGFQPRSVQTQVDNFAIKQGLTIIEAPTGSGKTEAALAYAVKLLNAGFADSLIFALPSQATANAMLARLTDVADRAFDQEKNVILAHGKSRFNKEFLDLKRVAQMNPAQGKQEAQVQCAGWLASSRKRVFLGRLGFVRLIRFCSRSYPYDINLSVLLVSGEASSLLMRYMLTTVICMVYSRKS